MRYTENMIKRIAARKAVEASNEVFKITVVERHSKEVTGELGWNVIDKLNINKTFRADKPVFLCTWKGKQMLLSNWLKEYTNALKASFEFELSKEEAQIQIIRTTSEEVVYKISYQCY